MKKPSVVIQSAVIFALIGLAAAYLAITQMPPVEQNSQSGGQAMTTMMIALGAPIAGASVGLLVGIIAVFVSHLTDSPSNSDAESIETTQAYTRK